MTRKDLKELLPRFITKQIEENRNGKVLEIENKNLSKIDSISDPEKMLWDFTPDFTFFIRRGVREEMGIVNIKNTISIVDIGEMLMFARICNPDYAFIIACKGISQEASVYLTKENDSKLLDYGLNSKIICFSIDEELNIIDDSLIPYESRGKVFE